jgi:hypothetical protein
MVAYEAGGLPAAAAVIAANPDRFQLNTSRTAIQVMGCADGLIAHLPLPSQEFSALVARVTALAPSVAKGMGTGVQ